MKWAPTECEVVETHGRMGEDAEDHPDADQDENDDRDDLDASEPVLSFAVTACQRMLSIKRIARKIALQRMEGVCGNQYFMTSAPAESSVGMVTAQLNQ